MAAGTGHLVAKRHVITVSVEFTEGVREDDAELAVREILVAGNNALGVKKVRQSLGLVSAHVNGEVTL